MWKDVVRNIEDENWIMDNNERDRPIKQLFWKINEINYGSLHEAINITISKLSKNNQYKFILLLVEMNYSNDEIKILT